MSLKLWCLTYRCKVRNLKAKQCPFKKAVKTVLIAMVLFFLRQAMGGFLNLAESRLQHASV